mmetsp:Transcript_105529/g.303387  ORF Transcript_105529/g.303387 Transcript_105529/m.303387 type:complete len:205 (-) Transcript_105529:1095-1709(-)
MGGLALRAATQAGLASPSTLGTPCVIRSTHPRPCLGRSQPRSRTSQTATSPGGSACTPLRSPHRHRRPPPNDRRPARPVQKGLALVIRSRLGTATSGSSVLRTAPTSASKNSAALSPSSRQVVAAMAAAAGAAWSRASPDSTTSPRRRAGTSRSQQARALAALRIEHLPTLSSATASPTASAWMDPSVSPSRSRSRVPASLPPS